MLRARTLLAISAAALALAGCTTTEIDDGKAESFLRQSVDGARDVDCPGGVAAEKGKTFECDIEYADGRKATATVHIRDDDGRIAVGPGDIKPAQ